MLQEVVLLKRSRTDDEPITKHGSDRPPVAFTGGGRWYRRSSAEMGAARVGGFFQETSWLFVTSVGLC
jgi:hypothetical protein